MIRKVAIRFFILQFIYKKTPYKNIRRFTSVNSKVILLSEARHLNIGEMTA